MKLLERVKSLDTRKFIIAVIVVIIILLFASGFVLIGANKPLVGIVFTGGSILACGAIVWKLLTDKSSKVGSDEFTDILQLNGAIDVSDASNEVFATGADESCDYTRNSDSDLNKLYESLAPSMIE